VYIQDGRVQAILPPDHGRTADRVLDASGLHVLPGVVDAHVHFNEPGRTDWEGFLTGSTAAAKAEPSAVFMKPRRSKLRPGTRLSTSASSCIALS
jgi:allantoinase